MIDRFEKEEKENQKEKQTMLGNHQGLNWCNVQGCHFDGKKKKNRNVDIINRLPVVVENQLYINRNTMVKTRNKTKQNKIK